MSAMVAGPMYFPGGAAPSVRPFPPPDRYQRRGSGARRKPRNKGQFKGPAQGQQNARGRRGRRRQPAAPTAWVPQQQGGGGGSYNIYESYLRTHMAQSFEYGFQNGKDMSKFWAQGGSSSQSDNSDAGSYGSRSRDASPRAEESRRSLKSEVGSADTPSWSPSQPSHDAARRGSFGETESVPTPGPGERVVVAPSGQMVILSAQIVNANHLL
mmetsp:Transcript_29459/g.94597  ORF Transcript_29459/g.94597 Transcript_29459/m.94597 type:complete len:212 (-) Transcript_29459:880-1515(-)